MTLALALIGFGALAVGAGAGDARPESPPVTSVARAVRPESAPSVSFDYQEPRNPAHAPLFGELRQRRVLEQFAELLSIIPYPRQLTLRFEGCDGKVNAFYSEKKATITFCYEFLAELERSAREAAEAPEISQRDAFDGPVAYYLLHEAGHATFHLLDVPLFGKEEDAADAFAAITLLRMGREVSLRVLRGAAWSFAHDARSARLDRSAFARKHSFDLQRYFNILCLAYGSDEEHFAGAVRRGGLPAGRAKYCVNEYIRASVAMNRLVTPWVDEQELRRVRLRHRSW